MGSSITILQKKYVGSSSVEISDTTISVKNTFIASQIETPVLELETSIDEHELEIIELQANVTLTPFDHAGLISDTFSDSTGYNNSVNAGETTATFSTNKYKRGNDDPSAIQFKFNDDYTELFGNTLTAHGTGNSFVAGKISNCLSLNGSGYASKTGVTGFASGNVDFSASVWYNPTAQPSSDETEPIVFFGSLASARDGFGINYRDTSGTKKLEFWSHSEANITINQTLTNGTWYHLIFTYTASTKTVEMFVNNSSIGTVVLSANMALNLNKISVGGLSSGTVSGLIDDARYFEKVLAADERAYIYNSGNGREELEPAENKKVTIDLSAYTDIPASVTATQLIIRDSDRETGDSITYDLVDSDSNTDTGLALNTKNTLVNCDPTKLAAGKILINLNKKDTNPTAGKPAIKTWALKMW